MNEKTPIFTCNLWGHSATSQLPPCCAFLAVDASCMTTRRWSKVTQRVREKHVCSLKQEKRLEDWGVNQKAYFILTAKRYIIQLY